MIHPQKQQQQQQQKTTKQNPSKPHKKPPTNNNNNKASLSIMLSPNIVICCYFTPGHLDDHLQATSLKTCYSFVICLLTTVYLMVYALRPCLDKKRYKYCVETIADGDGLDTSPEWMIMDWPPEGQSGKQNL